MFIPYKVDVPFNHRPVLNWLITGALVFIFVEEITADRSTISRFILDGWGLTGLFGHMWLHAGIIHLVGNLIFLWLFGNSVCSKIGNLLYLPVYVSLGLIAGISHLIFSTGSAIGASGAINGIVGMYLVFFPENSISCFFLLFFRPVFFSVSGFWMILLWFAFDLLGAVSGSQGTAYFAHIGGFIGGFGLAVLMLKMGWVVMERDEKSLLQMLSTRKKRVPDRFRPDSTPRQPRWVQAKNETEVRKPTPKEPAKPTNPYIRFNCRCGQRIKVAIAYAGQIGRCPKCRVPIRIPEPGIQKG